jgi:hypothetical protein
MNKPDNTIVSLACKDLLLRIREEAEPIDKVPWVVTYVANDNEYPFKHLDVLTDERCRQLSMEVVRRLLEQGAIVGGLSASPKERFLDPWPGTPDEIVQRFSDEWNKAGKCPDLYEIWIGMNNHPSPVA